METTIIDRKFKGLKKHSYGYVYKGDLKTDGDLDIKLDDTLIITNSNIVGGNMISNVSIEVRGFQEVRGWQEIRGYQEIYRSQEVKNYQEVSGWQEIRGYQEIGNYQKIGGYQIVGGYQEIGTQFEKGYYDEIGGYQVIGGFQEIGKHQILHESDQKIGRFQKIGGLQKITGGQFIGEEQAIRGDSIVGEGRVVMFSIETYGIMETGGDIFAGIYPWSEIDGKDKTITCKKMKGGEICHGILKETAR